MSLSRLPEEWRTLAAQQRRFGAEPQARTLEYCADELWSMLQASHDEPLNLQKASEESGYSAEHLGRLIREGKLPNAGRKARPLIRRKDLPIKPERQLTRPAEDTQTDYLSTRLFRDITTSKFGER